MRNPKKTKGALGSAFQRHKVFNGAAFNRPKRKQSQEKSDDAHNIRRGTRPQGESMYWFKAPSDLWGSSTHAMVAMELGLSDANAYVLIMRFWAWVARECPDGRLGSNRRRIECGIIWREMPDIDQGADLIECFKEAGLIEEDHCGFFVRDWYTEREKARDVAKSKAYRERKKREAANGSVTTVTECSPIRREENRRDQDLRSDLSAHTTSVLEQRSVDQTNECSASPQAAPCLLPEKVNGKKFEPDTERWTEKVAPIVEAWRKYHPQAFRAGLKAGEKTYRVVVARLKDGYTPEDIIDGIHGIHRSSFHCGGNDQQKRYLSLELVCRDASKLEGFRELWHEWRDNGDEAPKRPEKWELDYLASGHTVEQLEDFKKGLHFRVDSETQQ